MLKFPGVEIIEKLTEITQISTTLKINLNKSYTDGSQVRAEDVAYIDELNKLLNKVLGLYIENNL